MKIKRFFASSLREALNSVKEQLGADAVILSNNKVEGGVELVAAIDYDEGAIQSSVSAKKMDKKPLAQKSVASTENTSSFISMPAKDKVNTTSPEWLNRLRKIEQPPVKKEAENLLKHQEIKDDVVSFSQIKAQKENKRDPHINTSLIDEVMAEEQFSSVLKHSLNPQAKANVRQDFKASFYDRATEEDDHGAATYSRPLVNKAAAKRIAPQNVETKAKTKVKTKTNTSTAKASQQLEWSQDPVLTSMKSEILALKGMLENQLSGLAWGNFNRENPHRAEILQRLYKLGLKPSISETIIRQMNEATSLEDGWKKSLSLLSKGIKIAEEDLLTTDGMIAFVGPTGVGKTTTIAKLASRFALKYGPSDIALVSIDSYRVGAQEQLKIYGQLLRVPVYMVSNEAELKTTLARLSDKRLVLIDTAGMHQSDMRMTAQLSMLRKAYSGIKLISVLSASAQSDAMYEVINTFKPYGLDGCVVTKLDESTSLGGILSVLIENQLTLHYVTDGQKVPEDIKPGRVSNLLKNAMSIVRERKENYDYNDIAMSFVGELLHANG